MAIGKPADNLPEYVTARRKATHQELLMNGQPEIVVQIGQDEIKRYIKDGWTVDNQI